ncbi:MAG: DUF924 domain-containing protein [Rhodoferax sp.]|nr:DUF924 domain-containing protein [Rhodoferax sp.]
MPLPPPDDLAAPAHAAAILDFWFADGLTLGWPSRDLSVQWFGADAALDRQIDQQFGPWVRLALAGGLQGWEQDAAPGATPASTPGGTRLALILLLDQFSRNMFRGTAQAFAGDARAQQLVSEALAQGLDARLPWIARVFLYMPLMHAEHLALQEECVRRFSALAAQVPAVLQARIASHLDFARQHRDIIIRFGRFPHRNAALGRANTAQEQQFLEKGPRFGQ